VDVRYKWVKERVQRGELTLSWVEKSNMKADGLTKALNPMKQAHFVKVVGLTEVIEDENRGAGNDQSGGKLVCSRAKLVERAV
jgi:hypothetical protein